MKSLNPSGTTSKAAPQGAAALLLVSLASVSLLGCNDAQPSPPSIESAPPSATSARALVPAAAALDAPHSGSALRPYTAKATPGSIAVGNLNAQIEGREKALQHRDDLGLRASLVAAYLSRTQYLGSYSDFERAEEQVKLVLHKHPEDPQALLLKASVDGALHRFDAALETLNKAEKLGAKPEKLKAQRETIWMARGEHLDEVLKGREAAASKYPSYATLTALAAAQMSNGQFEAADNSFVEAVRKYRDVSPFPVAWVSFQRGVMWAERAGKPEKALPLYREAVRLLPQYVVANVHLAELEREAGKPDDAEQRLSQVLDPKGDPEPASVLAELLESKQPQRAAQYAAQAKRGYEALLARYPLAFADHATEFYLGPGKDPKRAQILAEQNLKNRPTERAFGLAIEASLANQDAKRACQLAKDPRLAQPKNPELVKLRDSAIKSCK